MSHCIVPDWNSRKRRQEEIEGEDQRNINTISSQVQQSPQNLSYIVPMSTNYELGDLAWGNYKQPMSLHGHGAIELPDPQPKPTWSSTSTGDTLESLVHQATCNNTTQLRHRGDLGPTYSASIPTSSAGKWVVASSSGVKWRENSTYIDMGQNLVSSMTASSGGKWRENSSHVQMDQQNDRGVKIGSMPTYSGLKISSMGDYSGGKKVENSSSGMVINKRIKSESEKYSGKNLFQVDERGSSAGGGVGASATVCKENTDTTMMTWASFESAPSMIKTPRNVDGDSACQDFSEEEFGNKEESGRSQSSARRTTRAAVVHNHSERRRRDRINEKMKALQKLVPNANKTDKASMLDEVIEYLKQLQAQVQMLTNARAISQMVMPLGMQQQLQMSLLGRMGMGQAGMGIVDVNNFRRNMPQPFTPILHGVTPLSTAPSFVSPPFSMPSLVPPLTNLKANVNADINRNMPDYNDCFGTFLAQQSMNMDFYNRMAILYRQQAIQTSKKPDSLSRQNNVQGD